MNDESVHRRFMRMALRLAERGAGLVSPNPMVGAVIVRDGRVVARGFHRAAGSDHAEIDALRQVDFKAEGCDIYVNLEPCCHSGRTPPCTDAIVDSGVGRVFIGMIDPNPLVSSRGVKLLEDRGIEVLTGVMEEKARRLNAAFSKWVRTGLPLVTLKMAATLDGKTAQRDGSARWISSTASRRTVHRMRSRSDCVIVGAGTARTDDPLLLPTLVRGGSRPARVVIDEEAGLARECRLVDTAWEAPVILYAVGDADQGRVAGLAKMGVEVETLDAAEGLVPLGDVLADLGRRGMLSVLVEGGPTLASSLVREGLVDRFVVFYAPGLLADPEARPMCGDMGIRELDGTMKFEVVSAKTVGPDVMVEMDSVRDPASGVRLPGSGVPEPPTVNGNGYGNG